MDTPILGRDLLLAATAALFGGSVVAAAIASAMATTRSHCKHCACLRCQADSSQSNWNYQPSTRSWVRSLLERVPWNVTPDICQLDVDEQRKNPLYSKCYSKGSSTTDHDFCAPGDELYPLQRNKSSRFFRSDSSRDMILSDQDSPDSMHSLSDRSAVQSGQQCPLLSRPDPFNPAKRDGYLSWDDYFMSIAFLSALRSKDPNRQVGACLVSQDQVILGIGYNGFPRGCSDDELPWAKMSATGDPLETKHPYVCHAEVNAILNKNHASANGQKLYVTMFPCNECAKIIIQAGITEVIYFTHRGTQHSESRSARDKLYAASHRMFSLAKVKVRQHQPKTQKLVLDFK